MVERLAVWLLVHPDVLLSMALTGCAIIGWLAITDRG